MAKRFNPMARRFNPMGKRFNPMAKRFNPMALRHRAENLYIYYIILFLLNIILKKWSDLRLPLINSFSISDITGNSVRKIFFHLLMWRLLRKILKNMCKITLQNQPENVDEIFFYSVRMGDAYILISRTGNFTKYPSRPYFNTIQKRFF